MHITDTVVIGAGHSGLALSAALADRGLDHVVLERGRIAERWRSERWDSLRLLTPNWMTELPRAPSRPDRDGFMTVAELVETLEQYAESSGGPLHEGVTVRGVHSLAGGFLVETQRCDYLAHNVVVATGHCGTPRVPELANRLPAGVAQIHSSEYRNPAQLPDGGVLVVGAGASGVQIAAELRTAGRSVVLSAGSHARAVRRYRGKDIWWWLDRIGTLDATADEVPDLDAARRSSSFGLTGANGGEDIDLAILRAAGVRIAGRMDAVSGSRVRFADDLADSTSNADRRLAGLLDRFDEWARTDGIGDDLSDAERPPPVRIGDPVVELDLEAARIGTVVWCTGYRAHYPWMNVPVLDDAGEIVHRRGVTPVPGMYAIGLRFQWTRGSHFIGRVGADAEYIADRVAERTERIEAASRRLVAAG